MHAVEAATGFDDLATYFFMPSVSLIPPFLVYQRTKINIVGV